MSLQIMDTSMEVWVETTTTSGQNFIKYNYNYLS